LEILSESEDINEVWENTEENIKTSGKKRVGMDELKQHKSWYNECLGFVDQRKQSTVQRIQNPSLNNVDNLNNVRREDSRHFRIKGGIAES
jgi:hypothetical protein